MIHMFHIPSYSPARITKLKYIKHHITIDCHKQPPWCKHCRLSGGGSMDVSGLSLPDRRFGWFECEHETNSLNNCHEIVRTIVRASYSVGQSIHLHKVGHNRKIDENSVTLTLSVSMRRFTFVFPLLLFLFLASFSNFCFSAYKLSTVFLIFCKSLEFTGAHAGRNNKFVW